MWSTHTPPTTQHPANPEGGPCNGRLRHGSQRRDAVAGRKRGTALRRRDVGIDDEVIVAIDEAVVVEVPVVVAEDTAVLTDVAVDAEVVVAVEQAVHIGVAAPGVHDQRIAGSDALP